MENGVQFRIGHSPITPGTHLCHFGNGRSRLETAAHSIATGIRAREVCLLICDDSLAKTIFIRLGAIGIDVHESVRKGALIHLHGEANGTELLGSIVMNLEKRCLAGARIVGCPGWHAKGWPDPPDLLAFEMLLDQVAHKYRALWMCVYDRSETPRAVLHVHPQILINGEVSANPAYIPPERFRRELRLGFSSRRFRP